MLRESVTDKSHDKLRRSGLVVFAKRTMLKFTPGQNAINTVKECEFKVFAYPPYLA